MVQEWYSLSLVPLTSGSSLVLYADLMTFYLATRRRAPCFPVESVTRYSEILEQVDSYHYLGVKNSPGQTSYIEQVIISTKARRLVGMLYRESYPWADTATLLNLYVTSFGASMPTVCGIRTPTRTSLCLSQSKSSHVSVFEMVGLRL